jgi:protein O-GlcNAc transferase
MDVTDSHATLAQQALQRRDTQAALLHARASLAAGEANAHRLLATVLPYTGGVDEALTHARHAVAEEDANAMDFARLASLLFATGATSDSIGHFRCAIEREPKSAVFWNELGVALSGVDVDESEQALRRAVGLAPKIAEIHNNLGNVLKKKGAPDEALECYQTALNLNPEYWDALGNMAVVQQSTGQPDAAIACFIKLLEVQPEHARYWTHYGAALAMKGQLGAAETAHRKALSINPELADAHNNLAIVLKDQGRLTEARDVYNKVIELAPEDAGAHSNLLMCFCYDGDVDALEMVAAHREWAQRHTPDTSSKITVDNANPGKTLTIGYVSPDFRNHSVASFVGGLLESYDTDGFRVICYSDVAAPDDTTAQMQGSASGWRNVVGLNDVQLNELIRRDNVDILVDLAGHTANNRLRVFAQRAAPIQISWLGYGATTGVAAMDYVLSDEWTDPAGNSESWFTETILRIPAGFMCFTPPECELPIRGPDRPPTFGSFNNLSKINDDVVTLWADLLRKTPNSKLVLKSRQLDDGQTKSALVGKFEALGVGSDRFSLELTVIFGDGVIRRRFGCGVFAVRRRH